MSAELFERYRDEIEDKYREMTPKSRAMLGTAKQYVAGGVTRETCWWKPYPVFVERGEGCYLYDIDGNVFLDHNNCFTAALLGHVHPKVVAAMNEAAPKLLGAGAATESIHQWAKILCDRFQSVDKVRFCCSGTEAVMFTFRAARAYTNKNKIMKQRGSYHGTINEVEPDMPTSSKGLPKNAAADMIYADYTNIEEIEKLVQDNKEDLAAILVNGIWFSKENDYLKFIKELAHENNILLIMDEVMSFRYALGGAQEYFNVMADLTAFGKFIGGGGLAVGAFGGRDDIMSLFSPLEQDEPVHHSGTFSANPVTVAAGIAALNEMTPELIARLNALGGELRTGFKEAFQEMEIQGGVSGESSLTMMRIGAPAIDPRRASAPETHQEIMRLFGLSLLNKTMFTPASGSLWALSEPMTENEIDQTVSAVKETLDELRPLIKEATPELILT
ncbi:MAG: aminotransferase class III-fold pyridoxal phosphate-dependent enzyme [Deltaproteobacteria bacterium]|nr:aminotransferase class III-fold pyridoxal phosphate-dependent enzyme [Deltaproteobacteria bacterium]MBW2085239.1 aminotransferase class III-fold pyridoxal phosphate-dependent enzyme [Deltaproteobacteria bacterium]